MNLLALLGGVAIAGVGAAYASACLKQGWFIRFVFWLLIALAGVWFTTAHAQDRLPEYTFTVTAPETDQLAAAIMELPKRIADPLLLKLSGQARAQETAAAQAKAAAAGAATAAPPVDNK